MATQVKGWPSGGSFTTITEDSKTHCAQKSTTFGVTLPPGMQSGALLAINVWHNCGGAGTAASRAQKIAKGNGIQLQEV